MTPTPQRIMLVDDSEDTLEILSAKLEHDGFSVTRAENGETGLDLIRADHPDIVFCDIMLPKMDGWSVLAALKADPDTREIPVILMTAYTTIQFQGERRQALDLGAVEYLRKPFDLREVSEILHRVLGDSGPGN